MAIREHIGPDDITPDDKDWTWVLRQGCGQCGFDVHALPAPDVARLIRENAAAWVTVLDGPDDELRRRPEPGRWSTLEYAAHVRDVYRLFLTRLELMIEHDDPRFENWDQDETARSQRYGEQDVDAVSRELEHAANALADRFDAVRPDEWERPGRRSDGTVFTVETFARYLIHDPVHHLWDVGRS